MAGAHGAELADASGSVTSRPIDQGPIDAAFEAISGYASRYGLLVERKHAGISLHFRSHPHLEDEARRFVANLAGAEAAFRVMQGNMVSELTLADINKGTAIRALMAEAPFAGRIPVCAGDDTTDEDSFAAVRSMGGAGIKIGAGPSRADYRLADVDAFVDWLRTCLNRDHISFEGLAACG
jgi:trehalose 6-phosphate phosphatase